MKRERSPAETSLITPVSLASEKQTHGCMAALPVAGPAPSFTRVTRSRTLYRNAITRDMLNSTSLTLQSLMDREKVYPSHSNIGVEKRVAIIKYISDICASQGYISETAYMALYYFDMHSKTYRIVHKKQLYLAALTCCSIAAKFAEELNEPKSSTLIASSEVEFDFVPAELKVS